MKYKVLIVDDADINRELLAEILKDDYEVIQAKDGRQALDIIQEEKEKLSVILLDLIMPQMDGFSLLKILREKKIVQKIPVLIISGDDNIHSEKECFELGVSDFIRKPYNAYIVKKRIENVVNHFTYEAKLEAKVAEQTAVLRKAYNTLQKQARQLESHNQEILDILGTVVEFRDLESGEHVQRVKGYTRILARAFQTQYPEYQLTDQMIDTIVSCSALHDLGKIAIPDSILSKPGKLTDEEFEYMKSHTIRGCEILDLMKGDWDPYFKQTSYDIVRHHHERYDGRGYPDGLKGEEIPVAAQLVSLADVYDALVNVRCYKDAYSTEQAFHMIVKGECGVFSPKLINAFCMTRKQFEELAVNMAETE